MLQILGRIEKGVKNFCCWNQDSKCTCPSRNKQKASSNFKSIPSEAIKHSHMPFALLICIKLVQTTSIKMKFRKPLFGNVWQENSIYEICTITGVLKYVCKTVPKKKMPTIREGYYQLFLLAGKPNRNMSFKNSIETIRINYCP